jgi:deazaflavin-dependent oxidoreductase (nitroreductase family)
VTAIEALADTEYCYLTTRGRRTGRPHRIESWFVAYDAGAYLLSDTGRSDRCRNLVADPHVSVEIAGERRETIARGVELDDPANTVVRRAMVAKYHDGYGRTSVRGRRPGGSRASTGRRDLRRARARRRDPGRR